MADWPQWRGALRNGTSPETVGWRGGKPRPLWQAAIGQGFSSVAVVGGKLYTLGNAGGTDWVHCLNAATGKPVWQYKYTCGAGDYGGPRATPTVHNGNVYTLSREGLALCLNAATGKLVWQQRLSGAVPQWGFAGSPLVQGSRVIYNVGTSGTALDKLTGKILWKTGEGPAGYAAPVAFDGGIAIFSAKALVAVSAATGKTLWQYPWETSYDVNAADPIFSGGQVFISSNYGKGGALLRLGSGAPQPVWQTRAMKNHFNTCVLHNGFLYGNDENTLRCLEWGTGRERWSLRGIDKGGLILAGNQLVVMGGRGELILLAADPNRLTEQARGTVLSGTCWTHPVLANGTLYCRNQEGTLVALNMRG
ncbi:PQQ-binding-like beta-propeller repeat protein [Armatimonas rosea]|uniref:Outer membrane protein assembly factor BamB n=1 Tax=Armatimonas rosea TaxID=685828 RepID=A0A7W9SPW4_ARMRO|nr:PQQ-binding-like beta-propeller repeat protein [Armatimonas rosea]MBB6050019.1 outer membrane protein assembly factor BamB [Armatimonas rosea]